LLGCTATDHPAEPGALGTPRSSDALLAVAAQPGPIRFEKVVAADWAVELSGLVNLDHPKARAAGLEDRSEPIAVYLYALHHPTQGTFLIDSGMERGFLDPASNERVGFLVRRAMGTDALRVRITTSDWIAANGGRLDGVLLTHIHLDHIMGVPDVPAGTPIYTGPDEVGASRFLHAFTRGTTNRLLGDRPALREWPFEPDPAGRFAGVLDVFGDGSLWALHVPGHTPGSTAFLVRTPDGPELVLGDATHTAWGWENGVEPGSYSLDGPRSVESLASLLALAEAIPGARVHPGHQDLGEVAAGPEAAARATGG
ncbi:MAG: MBL fold metallo-hydrolase, partial [Myxococcales bacterium]|nr:MBL fold metallo-hydrolase [Myxococcales bacterium]